MSALRDYLFNILAANLNYNLNVVHPRCANKYVTMKQSESNRVHVSAVWLYC